jgi:CRP-like cAMP-binding protein
MATEAREEPAIRWERLLDLDRDLAEALGDDIAAKARDRIGVATVALGEGSWEPQAVVAVGRRPFVLMVCEGLIVRELDLAGTLTADLLGPGDLVAVNPESEALLATGERWHVSARAKIAVLDDRVLPALHAWPALASLLIARAARQAARAAEQRAISQLPRVDLRIRAMLWHLAERWGRMAPSGVVVPLDLTHSAVGRLVGARRPTVTLALSKLARDGAVIRRDDGSWVLRVDSNPSARDRVELGVPGVAVVETHADLARRLGVAAPGPDGTTLHHRVERLRLISAQQQAYTRELLTRCEITRQRAQARRAVRSPAGR